MGSLMFGISDEKGRSLESHRTSRMLALHIRSYGFWNLVEKAQTFSLHMRKQSYEKPRVLESHIASEDIGAI